MSLTVVIAAPISNRPTKISGRAGRDLKVAIGEKYPDAKVVFIPDDRCIHDYAGVLKKYSDKGDVFFNYFGHGLSKKICGQIPPHCGKTKHGMFDPDNTDLLKDMITFALCCWTSHTYGRMVEEAGGKAYVGFRKPVFVGFDMEEHPYAKDMISVWLTFPMQMLEGNTVAGAISEMGSKSLEYENYYEENKDDLLYGDYYFKRFKSNRTAVVPFGDLSATLDDLPVVEKSVEAHSTAVLYDDVYFV